MSRSIWRIVAVGRGIRFANGGRELSKPGLFMVMKSSLVAGLSAAAFGARTAAEKFLDESS
jgi:hypothetical protein